MKKYRSMTPILFCLLMYSHLEQAYSQSRRVTSPIDERMFGTARREDIGEIIDHVTSSVGHDPYDTFRKHKGRVERDMVYFTFKTPKAGEYIFAFGISLSKNTKIKSKYQRAGRWIELPDGSVPSSYPDWVSLTEQCYWIDVPEGQTTTHFGVAVSGKPDNFRGALVAKPRRDSFEGMKGRSDESMFNLPDPVILQETDLGRAVARSCFGSAAENLAAPMGDEEFARAKRSLPNYIRLNAKYLVNQRLMSGICVEAIRYRLSRDKKFAQSAGMKSAQIATWPTWGYAAEFNVPASAVNGGSGGGGNIPRNHTLASAIQTTIMAMTYDLAYGGMDEPDRLELRRALDRFAHLLYVRSYLHADMFYGGGNWGGHFRSAVGMSGAAMYGENRYAPAWVARFKEALGPSLRIQLDPNGISTETIEYLGFGVIPNVLTAMAIERKHGGESIFEIEGGRLNHLVKSIVCLTSPSGLAIRDFGDAGSEMQLAGYRGLSERAAGMLMALSNAGGKYAEVARWAAQRGIGTFVNNGQTIRILSSGLFTHLNMLLFKPGSVVSPHAYPEDFPLGWHARTPLDYPRDAGYVVMRTGFESSDDVKLMLRCGHSEGHHGHPSQGSFILHAYGDYLSQPPGYNGWGRNTRSYNLITIDGRGQAQDHRRNRDENDGHIERFVHSSVADICIANNKPAYDGGRNRVARALRYFLFVRQPNRRAYTVVIDDVQKDDAKHRYAWNFHTTPNHTFEVVKGRGFVARGLSLEEGARLWNARGIDNRARRELSLSNSTSDLWYGYRWPAPSKRHPHVKAVKTDLRVDIVWPQEYSHEITFKGEIGYRDRSIFIPEHLAVSQRARTGLFFTVLYPESKALGVEMPDSKRIIEKDLWGIRMDGDTILFSRRTGVWKYQDIETDANLVYVRRNPKGEVPGFAIGEGTRLAVGGKDLFSAKKTVTASGDAISKIVSDDGGAWRSTSPARGLQVD